MVNLEELFKKAYETGRDVQEKEQSGEQINGQAIWQSLESQTGNLKDIELLNEQNENLKYDGENLAKLYEEMDKIFIKYDMPNNEMNPKSNHFFCQLKNLVVKKSNYNIKLNRVMQLGFNAGQLSIFIEKNTLLADRKEEIVKLVNDFNMLNLNTYVSEKNQEIIKDKYLSQMSGAGGYDVYYSKYLKYKSKYMHLKR